MKFDFENDLKQELIQGLKHFPVKISKHNDINGYIIDYLTIMKKVVRTGRRKVIYNPDFLSDLSNHPKHVEIKHLENCFTKGLDVNYFQTDKLFQTRFHDHLSYEWNIFHFHLSLQKNGKFAKRSDTLLFVYITDEQAIFLGTDTHRDGVFGDTKWQEVLHDHFYHILEPYYDPEIKDILPGIKTGVERQMIWDKGLTIGLTKIRDKVFRSPGIGRSTSKHSILVTDQMVLIYRWLTRMKEQFSEHWPWVCFRINVDPDKAFFRLKIGQHNIEIYESTSNKHILTYPEWLAHPSLIGDEVKN